MREGGWAGERGGGKAGRRGGAALAMALVRLTLPGSYFVAVGPPASVITKVKAPFIVPRGRERERERGREPRAEMRETKVHRKVLSRWAARG